MAEWEKRVTREARYVARTGKTVRDTAKVFGVGKSTVHKDLTVRLPMLNARLYKKVQKVLQTNKQERHLRGGEATKKMWKTKREN